MTALLNLALQLAELLRLVPHRLRGAVYGSLAAIGAIALVIVCLPFTRAWFGLEHAPPPLVILVAVFNFMVSLTGLLARANTQPHAVPRGPGSRTKPDVHVHFSGQPPATKDLAREIVDSLRSYERKTGRIRRQ
jgi:hypothetical protein